MRRLVLLVIALVVTGTDTARASGPPLNATPADLAASLECPQDLTDAPREPVLLIPGTTVTPEQYRWNYMPALTAAGIPWCAVEPPGNMMADIQLSAEYVVNAIRVMAKRSGHKVDIIGHSQGGMISRWGLKFWPDTRLKVDDLIALAPSNHGTSIAAAVCNPRCAAAIWQQRDDSAFLAVLNAGAETYAPISYSNVYSEYDQIVVPNYGPNASSRLTTGDGDIANIATQDVCSLNTADHVTNGTSDPVAWAAAVDALEHPGPADPARIDTAVCAEPFMPGVNPATFAIDLAATGGILLEGLSGAEQIPEEPPLRCYVTNSCPTVVRRPTRCTVPDVIGQRVTAARTLLRRAGCRLGRVRGRQGRVVRQHPRAGAVRVKGKRVRIRIR